MSSIPVGIDKIDVWIPVPVSDDRQTVKLISVSDTKGIFTTESKYGNRMYYRQFDPRKEKQNDSIKIVFSYELILREKSVSEAKQLLALPNVQPDKDLHVYLSDNRLIPLQGAIVQLANQMELPNQPILAARKVYDNLITRMVYNYKALDAGIGDALWACNSKTGDCSDYHSVFIGICRSEGIPADHEFGLPLRTGQKTHMVKDWHCWAKFWVKGPGWITIDASEADKHPELKEYLFGTLSSDYLTISHGRDVTLQPAQQSLPLNIFADPYSEVDGLPFAGIKCIGFFKE